MTRRPPLFVYAGNRDADMINRFYARCPVRDVAWLRLYLRRLGDDVRPGPRRMDKTNRRNA